MIRVERHPFGRQLFVFNHRCHHWPFALAGSLLFAAWFWTDRNDFMDWLVK